MDAMFNLLPKDSAGWKSRYTRACTYYERHMTDKEVMYLSGGIMLGHYDIYENDYGFIIVDNNYEDDGFHVLFGYGFDKGAFKASEDALNDLAFTKGCAEITFSTHRKGWRKLLSTRWYEHAPGEWSRFVRVPSFC